MAKSVTARFGADFSGFLAAAQAAEGSLQKLMDAAGVTESRVKSLTASFSGGSIISQATAVAQAIEKIGGPTKLTASEMERVNRITNEALTKMQALGVQAPPELQKLADATKRVETETVNAAKSTSTLTSAFASMTAAFSAGAILNQLIGSIQQFAVHALESAGNLVDLRGATGVSLDMLQRWTLVAQQGGIELENLTKASFKLGNQLSEGKASTRGAVEALGLSFEQLRSMKPEQQLDAVLKAAEPIGNTTERNAILTTLFGEKASLALARVIDGYTKLADSTRVATDSQIEAVDRATNAYDRLKQTITTGFVQALGNVFRQATETGLAIDQMTDAERNHYMALVRSGGGAELYAIQLKDQRDAQEQATKAALDSDQAHASVTTTQKNYRDILKQTLAEIQKLDPETRKQIQAARDLGVSEEELMDRFGLTATALKVLVGVERTAEEAQKKHAEEAKKAAEAQRELAERMRDLNVKNNDAVIATQKWFATLERLGVGVLEPVSRLTTTYKFSIDQLNTSIETSKSALIGYTGNLNKTAEEQRALSLQSEKLAEKTTKLGDAWSKAGATIANAVAGGGNPFKALGASLGGAFGEDLGAMAAKAIGGKLGSAIGSSMGPLGAMAGQLLGAGFGKALGWITGLFSNPMKKEIEAANREIDKLKDKMLEHVGNVDELESRYNALGLSIREAFAGQGKQGLEALKAVQDEFNKRLEESKTRLADLQGELKNLQGELDGLIGKANEMGYVFNTQGELIGFNFDRVAQVARDFGVDLAALGPAFQQAQLTAEAQKVIDAFTLLTMSGADVGAVLVGMKDEINKIVRDSLQFGTTIPANMKPWIEELIRTGQLTDANGQKITDLSQIKFGDPVKSQYEKINDSIQTVLSAMQDLIGQISNLVGAIDAATRPRTLTVTAQYVDPGPPPDFGDPTRGRNGSGLGADQERAVGTMGATGGWFENFGPGRLVRLHGQEAVVRRDQANAFASDMGGGADVAAEVAGLRADMYDALPRAIARAMRDALQLAGAV